MKIGFTGSQLSITAVQKATLASLLLALNPAEFHHGDCVGADENAHTIVRANLPNCKIIIHPPESVLKQALCKGDESKEAKPYLVRNHDIVDGCDLLLATPRQYNEQLRSGTWATVRYAIKSGKPVRLIYPDGTTKIII